MATLEYLREYRTYARIAASYGIAESNIYRGIDEGGNKDRVALNLRITRRQVNRLIKACREKGTEINF